MDVSLRDTKPGAGNCPLSLGAEYWTTGPHAIKMES